MHYRYANGLTMHVWSEVPGIKFEGTDGWIMFRGWRGVPTASDPDILKQTVPEEKRLHRPKTIVARNNSDRLGGGEHLDFTDCIKNGKTTYAPAEIGHRTISISHMGNIAMLLGKKLKWNPDTEQFDNDDANKMLTREQREPWTIANVDSWINVG